MNNETILLQEEFITHFGACLTARADFEKACISRDVDALTMAFDLVFEQVLKFPDIELPLIASVPEMQNLVQEARAFSRSIASKEKNERYRAEWVAKLPSASELLQEAITAGERFEFNGYTLWKEADGWSLTNAYGIDNCAFLSTEKNFGWLLRCVREDKDIGPVPPMCEDPDDYDLHEARIGACYDAALELHAQLSKDGYP